VADDFVIALLHGCTQGPRAWERVAAGLRARGIASTALDLEPARFDRGGSVDCAREITRQLRPYEKVVLVSTSCSGLLAPVVATLRPLQRLVFVCAGLPDIGRSATAQIADDGLLRTEWMQWEGDPVDPEAARRFMFHDCADRDIDWCLQTVRLFLPQLVYDEVTPLTEWPDVPSTYVVGTRDRIISPEWARGAVASRLGIVPIEIPTGHCPQNSQPDRLVRILAETVAG
jgi:pimeloyl-ACP methyl ester carboxylesterase